ncbi:somatostatin receptor type 5 [Chanos chanos]|uniref:Somatostatin receptor type 5 n=1 Tax=Chanos chanos TaxID=29144 RepID=A0A6J2WQ03_CHACN|nr:somatostatin receptor type 5-like [Chanos chanos]
MNPVTLVLCNVSSFLRDEPPSQPRDPTSCSPEMEVQMFMSYPGDPNQSSTVPMQTDNNNSNVTRAFVASTTKIMSVIYLIVFVLGLIGNTLAIFVVLRYAKMKTVTNMYILNLAVADELYILGLPFQTAHNVLSYWPFGDFLCSVVMWADSISQFTSTFCLTVMSIDRYMAVVHPIRSTKWRRPRTAKIINALVWALSCLLSLPVIIFSDVQEDLNTCNMSWPEPNNLWSTVFILYTSILGFFCPLLVITMCYLLIVIKVKSARARAGLTRRRKSERKVTRMVVIIVVIFVLCWLPFFILNIVNLIITLPETSLIAGIYFLAVILTYVNSCANPLLYGFLSENFKQSFRKVLCVHKANGVRDGDPGQIRATRPSAHDPCFTPRAMDFNGYHQNNQLK